MASPPNLRSRLVGAFCVVTIAIACWASFARILDWYFIDIDTLALVSTGRFRSVQDLWAIWTQPLMGDLMPNARFFRPATSLSWGLDELIWGLEPVGYHLTDLLLHTANSVLVFWFFRALWRCFGGENGPPHIETIGVPFAAALLFAVGPGQVEFLPAIARRPDLLALLFGLSTWILVLSWVDHPSRLLGVLAGVCCFFSLASKEIAILVPVQAGLLLLLHPKRPGAPTVPLCSLGLATLAFVVWRTIVLRGFGGYVPIDDAGHLTHMLSGLWVELLLLVVPGHLNQVSAALQAWTVPLAWGALVGAGLVAVWCVGAWWRGKLADRRKLWVSCGAVSLFLLPVAVGWMRPRQMYFHLAFFAVGLVWLSARGFQVTDRLRRTLVSGGWRYRDFLTLVVGALATASIAISLSKSPLFGYNEGLDRWRRTGEVARAALEGSVPALADAPTGATVYLVNFPYQVRFGDDPAGIEQPETPVLLEHSVQGWADLRFPDKRFDVVGLTYLDVDTAEPVDFDVQVAFAWPRRMLAVDVAEGASARLFPWPNDFGRHDYRKIYWGSEHRWPSGMASGLGVRLWLRGSLDRPVVFLVFTGSRVEHRTLTDFRIRSRDPSGAPGS